MRNVILMMGFVFAVFGAGCARQEPTAIQIGDIRISPREFEAAYQASGYDALKVPGRKAFLESYISTKLILKEAQKAGLDKDPKLLADIQRYWEKALLKLMLERKSKDLGMDVAVTDQEVSQYYREHKAAYFPEKQLMQVYDQIKWMLLREKQRVVVADWVESLKTETDIKINYDLLGIK